MKDTEAKRLALEKAQIEALIVKHKPHTPKTPGEVNTSGTGKNANIDDQEGTEKVKPPKRGQKTSARKGQKNTNTKDMKDTEAKRLALEKAQIEALIVKHKPHTPKTPGEVNTSGTGKNANIDDQEGTEKVKPPNKKATKDSQIKMS